MAGVAEALALARRCGLDPQLMTSIFNSSSARCWASESYSPAPVSSGGAPCPAANAALPPSEPPRRLPSELPASAPTAPQGVQEGVPSSRGYAGGFASRLMVKDLGLVLAAAEG
jgi:3-hydroxyisobutyrate dehydrogenase